MDTRSIGYYKVKKSIIHHHLKPYYEFKLLQVLCEELHTLTNPVKTEEHHSTDPYPWEPEDDERRLRDKEILEKYIVLERLHV